MAQKAFAFVSVLAALVSVYAVPQAFSGQQTPFPSTTHVDAVYYEYDLDPK